MGRKVAKFKYVGNESDVMVHGQYYSYKDIQDINGMLMTSIRSRMSKSYQDGERVITDQILQDKTPLPFYTLDGKKVSQGVKVIFEDRCETDCEKLSDRYLRIAL
nr:hypothetical protein [uncultured Mediterranean phage uvMED]